MNAMGVYMVIPVIRITTYLRPEVVAEAPDLENLPVLKNEEKDEKDGHPMGSNEVHDQSFGCYIYLRNPKPKNSKCCAKNTMFTGKTLGFGNVGFSSCSTACSMLPLRLFAKKNA